MKLSGESVLKGVIYTAIAFCVLGLVKSAVPDVWAKIPGLNQF